MRRSRVGHGPDRGRAVVALADVEDEDEQEGEEEYKEEGEESGGEAAAV